MLCLIFMCHWVGLGPWDNMMGWVGLGVNLSGLGWVRLGLRKWTHNQLWWSGYSNQMDGDRVGTVVWLCCLFVVEWTMNTFDWCLQESLQNYKTVQLISKEAFDELHSNAAPPVPANQKVPPPPPLPAATVSGQFLQAVFRAVPNNLSKTSTRLQLEVS